MRIAFIAATAALGGLLFGYDTGVISGALLFLREAFHLSNMMMGVVTSIALAGAAGVAAVAGLLADRFGRRPVLIATALVFVSGAIVSAIADSLILLLAGRLLVGVGIGGASMTFLRLVDLLGRPGVFFVYAALTAGAFLFARALVPETKGLSLEAVEVLWEKREEKRSAGRTRLKIS